MKMGKKFKVALVLGGGGARGFAHIGVIKVLNWHSIPIDMIVGTSMGAIVGAAYCLNPDVNILEKEILEMGQQPQIKKLESLFAYTSVENQRNLIIQKLLGRIKDVCLWNLRAAKKWIVRSEPIIRVLDNLFNDKCFSDVKIPFACVAVDLNSASDVIIQEGPILEAVLASSAIPGVFAPVKRGNQLLVDGGILSSVPARQARILGADFVIGVDLSIQYSEKHLITGLDVMFQADQLKAHYLNKLNLKYCDWVISPDVLSVDWSGFSLGSFCLHQGEVAADGEINKIKNLLNKKKRECFFQNIFNLK